MKILNDNKKMKNVMLIYPTGKLFQRSEDRCQINVTSSCANSLRACNDLGYSASILRCDYNIFLKDYPSEKLSFSDLKKDIIEFSPDIILMSITNGSIFDDIKVATEIKKIKNDVSIILKGALFFNPDKDLFTELDLSSIDYLIGGEIEFIIKDLINAHFNDKNQLRNIEGISYKINGNWISNNLTNFNENLDEIPFPARDLMNNNLYINPLTNRKMATISTSKGCPSSCIYCLSPIISGKKVRFRTTENVISEINECVNKYEIYDFFFKSDTFTINKKWVIELCNKIINSGLKNKINWVANSRVNTLDEEMILKMKEAGCSLIALGLESGSNESLLKMQKGTTVEQNIKTVNLIKKNGLKTFGFYMIGFDWETKKHLKETEKHIFKLDTDFIEISLVVAYKGSELYKKLYQNGSSQMLGTEVFKTSTIQNKFMSRKEIENFRKNIILKYYLRPNFIFKKIFSKGITISILFNYLKYGIRLLKNFISH
jgi:radical SAM superfamily enzyme YgiQ (UPF0313 family)